MSSKLTNFIWKTGLVLIVLFIVTALLIIPPNPRPQNYILSVVAVLAGARIFMKY